MRTVESMKGRHVVLVVLGEVWCSEEEQSTGRGEDKNSSAGDQNLLPPQAAAPPNPEN
jgi:hypothetical protein